MGNKQEDDDDYEPDHPNLEAISEFYAAIRAADEASLARSLRKFDILELSEIKVLAHLLDAADPQLNLPVKLTLSRLKEGRPPDPGRAHTPLSIWIKVKQAIKHHTCGVEAAFKYVATETGLSRGTIKSYYYRHCKEKARLKNKDK